MPEIKHNFTSGKMNKDLDERLVPDGEYRDAMNVQVSTSEGSDVGTIQNILPNNYGCTDEAGVPIPSMGNLIGPHATTVGSISDEKNDSLYWFVSNHNTSSLTTATPDGVLSAAGGNSFSSSWWGNLNLSTGSGKYLLKDIIMEAKIGKTTAVVGDDAGNIIISKPTALCAPVFVDVWGFIINSVGGSISGDLYFNVGDVELANLLEPGWKIASIKPLGQGGIQAVSTVESLVEYASTHVNVTPRMTTTTSWVQEGDYIRVALGVTQQPGALNWEYDGNIYLQVDVNPVSGDEIIGGAPGMGLQYKPQVGDEIRNFGINPGVNARAAIEFDDGTTSANISTTATISSVGAYQTTNSSSATYDWWKITVQEDMVFASSFGQGFLNSTGSNMSTVYSEYWLAAGEGLLTDPGKYKMEVFNSISGTTPDGSGTMEFNVSQNLILSGADEGDEIGWSPTYLAYDDLHQLSPPMCIYHLELAVPPEYVFSFPSFYWTDPIPGEIIISEWDSASNTCTGNIIQPQFSSTGGGFGGATINIQGVEETIVKLDLPFDSTYLGQDLPVIFYNPNRVLNFNIDKLVTGINIVDDLLFWTDGDSEPKKINIKRSLQGTDDTGLLHTKLVNTFTSPASGYVPVREEHVTVIKKAPNKTITVAAEDFTSLENAEIFSVLHGSAGNNEFEDMTVAQTTLISIEWDGLGDFPSSATPQVLDGIQLNDVLRFSSSLSSLTNYVFDDLLNGEYEIRAVVTDVSIATTSVGWATIGYKVFRLEILSIKADARITGPPPNWYAVVEGTGKRLFERKLPRFSYRYKYLDNEYSTFATILQRLIIPRW